MQQALLDHLRVVTEEEQRILDGVAEVDKRPLYIWEGFHGGQCENAQ